MRLSYVWVTPFTTRCDGHKLWWVWGGGPHNERSVWKVRREACEVRGDLRRRVGNLLVAINYEAGKAISARERKKRGKVTRSGEFFPSAKHVNSPLKRPPAKPVFLSAKPTPVLRSPRPDRGILPRRPCTLRTSTPSRELLVSRTPSTFPTRTNCLRWILRAC